MLPPSATPSKHTRPKLTPEQARHFTTWSIANALVVQSATTANGCACDAYADVFTFNRWRAQGQTVQRGQHAIATIPVWIHPEPVENPVPGVKYHPTLCRGVAVFCRCQVAPAGAR